MREIFLDIRSEVISVLDSVLNLHGRAAAFKDDTPLLGSVPELDSMAVVAVITSLEEHFGFEVNDDDIDGATFQTLGSLLRFVEAKCALLCEAELVASQTLVTREIECAEKTGTYQADEQEIVEMA